MAEVPPGVVTVTSTVPVPAGAVAMIEVVLSPVTVAGLDPNSTEVAPERLVPVMVTLVPPEELPAVGLMEETAGTAT